VRQFVWVNWSAGASPVFVKCSYLVMGYAGSGPSQ
jgi:hypothetical protein